MVLGIDIGGTNIKFGIVDENYQILAHRSIPTRKEAGGDVIVSDIIKVCLELKELFPYDKFGIGTPGVVDSEHGICVSAANLPFSNTALVPLVSAATGLKGTLANDANCAIWGELYAGSGKEYKNFLMITLGTGVGGGIVIDGQVYNGSRGGAGELGHMVIDYGGLPCPCGQVGCWEQYASVNALIEQTRFAAQSAPDSILASLCSEKITGRTAFDAAKMGCVVGQSVIETYTNYILIGLSSLDYIFQPDMIVLGGAVTNQGAALLEPLERKQTFSSKICISNLKNDAGVIGAAAVAMHT